MKNESRSKMLGAAALVVACMLCVLCMLCLACSDDADQGVQDGSSNVWQDSGTQDSGTQDSGTQDSGTQDSGTQDSGTEDSGTEDSGTEDNGTEDSAALDSSPLDEGSPEVGPAADTSVVDGGGAGFACGALDTCSEGEYCERVTPGVCGGSPVPDSGPCPPNCSPTTCPGGQMVCLCESYTCQPLPSGCASCACLPSSGGCFCTDGPGGEINVHCMLP